MPCVGPISLKYSIGFMRTRAPVGQFSSHEYACRRAPGGLSVVSSQRLHLTATMSLDIVGAAGSSILKLSVFVRCERKPLFGAASSRGTMEIALYGHSRAQSQQPIHVFEPISMWPCGSRKIAPVGQPVKHSGSAQCMQTCGTSACCKRLLPIVTGRSI